MVKNMVADAQRTLSQETESLMEFSTVLAGENIIIEVDKLNLFYDETQALTRDGMILRDNVFGTLAEDAWRRDFSANALYYNIADFILCHFPSPK